MPNNSPVNGGCKPVFDQKAIELGIRQDVGRLAYCGQESSEQKRKQIETCRRLVRRFSADTRERMRKH